MRGRAGSCAHDVDGTASESPRRPAGLPCFCSDRRRMRVSRRLSGARSPLLITRRNYGLNLPKSASLNRTRVLYKPITGWQLGSVVAFSMQGHVEGTRNSCGCNRPACHLHALQGDQAECTTLLNELSKLQFEERTDGRVSSVPRFFTGIRHSTHQDPVVYCAERHIDM